MTGEPADEAVLRRRANGESIEDIRPDLIIPTGKRKGRNPRARDLNRLRKLNPALNNFDDWPADYASKIKPG